MVPGNDQGCDIFHRDVLFWHLCYFYFAIRGFRTCRCDKKKAEAMLTWSTITAIAIKPEVVYGTASRGRYRHYAPKITYTYNLNNEDYFIDVNDQNFYLSNGELQAKNDAEQLGKSIVEESKTIHIYYNPNDPSESAAETDHKSCTPIFVVVVVISLFLLVFISFPLAALGMIMYAYFKHWH